MADKKLARRLAETINNTQIVEGKKKKFSEHMWNIKYLSRYNIKKQWIYFHFKQKSIFIIWQRIIFNFNNYRFRWTHLTERLAYEKAVYKQKIRTESAQARRETEAFIANVEASKKFASIKERKEKKGVKLVEKRKMMEFKQRKTVAEMQALKAKKHKLNDHDNKNEVLSKIFGGSWYCVFK